MDGSWFNQALERVGAAQADLARHLRLAPSAVSRILKGERQIKPVEFVHIAGFLRVPVDEVVRHAVDGTTPTLAADAPRSGRGRPPSTVSATPPARLMHEPDRIPIRSGARGGSDQEMFLEDAPIGYTPRPSNLNGVRSAYAIYMTGDGMEPRYQQGWLLHVHPFKPPTRGRDVVVYRKDKTVLIKQFVGWDGSALVLQQLNPARELKFPRDDVA